MAGSSDELKSDNFYKLLRLPCDMTAPESERGCESQTKEGAEQSYRGGDVGTWRGRL